MIAIAGKIERQRPFAPLTPALSPLKGEGATIVAANFASAVPVTEHQTRPLMCIQPTMRFASPSPLNGERAGVRGEAVRLASALAPRSNVHHGSTVQRFNGSRPPHSLNS